MSPGVHKVCSDRDGKFGVQAISGVGGGIGGRLGEERAKVGIQVEGGSEEP